MDISLNENEVMTTVRGLDLIEHPYLDESLPSEGKQKFEEILEMVRKFNATYKVCEIFNTETGDGRYIVAAR